MTEDEANRAIDARRSGVWDEPALVAFGPLSTSTEADVTEIMRRRLVDTCGFQIGARNPQLNRKFPGAFMVLECPDEVTGPTDDGSEGPWCIVGDDLPALIAEAFDRFQGHYLP